jgi:hypothetical protein
VNNVPDDALDYIVARWSKETSSLWFWGSWETKEQANEISKLVDGIVVKRVKN